MSVISITSLNEFRLLISKPSLTVADFFATWCGPCQVISSQFEQLSREKSNTTFCKINVDICKDIVREFPVKCMPTFKFFKSGREIETFEGADIVSIRRIVAANEYIPPPPIPKSTDLVKLPPKEILVLMRQHNINPAGCLEKSELIAAIEEYRSSSNNV